MTSDYANAQYYTEITLGNPAQSVRITSLSILIGSRTDRFFTLVVQGNVVVWARRRTAVMY